MILSLISSLIMLSCKGPVEGNAVSFDLKTIAKRNTGLSIIQKSEVFGQKVLNINPTDDNASLTIWEYGDKGNWSDAKYLIFEIWDAEEYSGVINIEFYREMADDRVETIVLQSGELAIKQQDAPWLSCLIGDTSKT